MKQNNLNRDPNWDPRSNPDHRSNPKKLEDKLNPTLKDRSYEPDPTSLNNRLIIKRTKNEKTGAVIMPSWPYQMPQIPGGVVYGVYNIPSHSINVDITKSEYANTQKHELLHAKGHGEYMTRFLNNDPPADYN